MAFARASDGKSSANHRYLWLDFARGIAAISVMLYHYQEFTGYSHLFKAAYLAVDLFFMMSGFVIAHAYGAKLFQSMSTFEYVVARLVRLYPVYLFATLFGAGYYLSKVVLATDDAAAMTDILAILAHNLFFFPFSETIAEPSGIFPFSPAAWSLSVEVVLSIFFVIALWHFRTRNLLLTFVGSGLICLMFAARYGTLDFGFSMEGFFPAIFRAVAEFSLGIWLYRRFGGVRVNSNIAAAAVLAGITLALVFLTPTLPVSVLVVVIAFPLLFLVQPMVEPSGITAKVFSEFGRISYPVYLLHTPVLLWGAGILKFLNIDPLNYTPWIGLALAVCSIAMSWIVAVLFDEPVRRWLNKQVKKAKARGAQASSEQHSRSTH